MLKLTVKKLPGSMVEIEGELEAPIFEGFWDQALKKIGQHVEVAGFRKGKIPENILLSKVPEISILEEMAEMALGKYYGEILEQEKIDAIGRPEIAITKLARNNPLGFKITTTVLPEVQLGDYKESAKKVLVEVTDAEKNIVVTDEDVENTIMDIRKSRAPKKHVTEAAKEGEEKAMEAVEELPEFNDEYVQAMGPFKDVADFKAKLKDNLKLEKENLQKEKTRLKIIEKIIDEAKVEVPEILVKSEIDKILYRMESDITQMGLKFEDYLKHLNKTADDLRKEMRPDAEKKAKLELIIKKISEVEKLIADEEQVEKEVAHLLEHYKDADPERARIHAENVLTNEKVFTFLENQ